MLHIPGHANVAWPGGSSVMSCAVATPKCWLQYMVAACWAAGKPSGGVYITVTRRGDPAAGSAVGADAGAVVSGGGFAVVSDVQAAARPAAASARMRRDFIARSSRTWPRYSA